MPDFAVKTAFTATDKISPAFRRMGNRADVFASRTTRAMSTVNKGVSGLIGSFKSLLPVLGVGAVVGFASKSIDAFNKQEAAIANVEAGLKSTNYALGTSSKMLQVYASRIQSQGIFGDEDILQNLTAQFLTFGNIGKSNFQRIQVAATDVTAKLYGVQASGEQLKATAIMMGKAMDDPARGMAAMRRVGISFSAQEEQMVKGMVAANNTVGAQNLMLKAIEKQYGGTNKALAQTNAGMQRMAENNIGDTMENIGQQLIPMKMAFYEFVQYLLPKINEYLPAMVGFFKDMAPYVAALVAGFVAYKAALIGVAVWQGIVAAAGWIKYLYEMAPLIMKSVKAQGLFTKALKGTAIWESIVTAKATVMKKAMLGVNAAMKVGAIGLIGAAIMGIYYKFEELKKQFDYVSDNWEEISAAWGDLWQGMKDTFSAVIDWIVEKFTGAVDWIGNKINAIGEFFSLTKQPIVTPGVDMSQVEAAKFQLGQFNEAAKVAASAGNTFAPNASQVDAQKIRLQGEININGAPQGTTVKSSTKGAQPIRMNLVGQN